MEITITEDSDLWPQLGRAEWEGNTCKIVLRKYPFCKVHELMHCFAGHWHPPRERNDKYCYLNKKEFSF